MSPKLNYHPPFSRTLIAALVAALAVLLAACSSAETEPPPLATDVAAVEEAPAVPPTEAPTVPPPTATPIPPTATTEPPTATPEPTSIPLSDLPPDPQRIEFAAEDGKQLVGYYYPSKFASAPVVVLMHWAGGDVCTWADVAPWLQNRLDEGAARLARCDVKVGETWWDPSWFPPVLPEVSFAVFAFDFRDFGESAPGLEDRADFQKDALAAFHTAAGLEGVDPVQMTAIGASIGSDGAPDGCYLYNSEVGGGCLGALSLSPGSYLRLEYATVVQDLDGAGVPVWCLAAENDYESPATCNSASGEHYQVFIYPGYEHGPQLLKPGQEPDTMMVIQDFLEEVFDLEIN